MNDVRAFLLCACIALYLHPGAARSHEGHDDAAPSASAIPGAGVPRVEAQSDLFEIVGVVGNGTMTLFLDRYATNEPVAGAKIDVEAGPMKGSAQANADGTYTFKSAALAQPGTVPVTFTIAAGGDSDLLAGELVIAGSGATAPRGDADALRNRKWWIAGGLIAFAVVVVAWWLRRKRVKGIVE